MNRYARQLFESIRTEADSHRKEVGKILATYMNAKEQAASYKDEAGRIAAAAQKARDSITVQVSTFGSSIKPDIENLRNELNTYLLSAPSDKVSNVLNLYGRIDDISETEAAALLGKCDGNYIAMRMLDSIIKKAGLRVKFPDVSEFENDLRILEALSSESYIAPDELFNPLCEVLVGTPRPVPGADGKTLEAGYSWSINNLATARSVFNSHVEKISRMAERWAGDLRPTIFRPELYPTDKEEAAKAFITDESRSNKGKLQTDPNHAAKQRAATYAEREAQAAAIRESYTSH